MPDPNLPFLGVHLTRMIDGGVTVGPSAVLGFAREGYGSRSLKTAGIETTGFIWSRIVYVPGDAEVFVVPGGVVHYVDTRDILLYGGFWRLLTRYWRSAAAEFRGSLLASGSCACYAGAVCARASEFSVEKAKDSASSAMRY